MRSKGDIDIGGVAKEFEGGGHKNAAGCTVTGAIETLQKMFVAKIEHAIECTAC
jgi:bifunctional oligoribonuclease and PAP phosphatase NrnA